MKVNWNYIKSFAILTLVVFLYSFSSRRNSARKIEDIKVEFTNGDNLYITENAVNKLLIVNEDTVKNQQKHVVDLSKLEQVLDTHQMIDNAEVYLTIDKRLIANITQRQPVARVYGQRSFYIDANGAEMPLSKVYTARVPLVLGISEKEVQEVFPLIQKINNDKFLKEHIVSITKKQGAYQLGMRVLDFTVDFGSIKNIDNKINNFKAFYKKALKENQLHTYKTVSLKFDNQVVCTKN